MEGTQWIVNAILSIAMAALGWIANDMKRRLEALEEANETNGRLVAVLGNEQNNISKRLEKMDQKLDRLLERRVHPRAD